MEKSPATMAAGVPLLAAKNSPRTASTTTPSAISQTSVALLRAGGGTLLQETSLRHAESLPIGAPVTHKNAETWARPRPGRRRIPMVSLTPQEGGYFASTWTTSRPARCSRLAATPGAVAGGAVHPDPPAGISASRPSSSCSGMFTAPATWPASYSSARRTSSTASPAAALVQTAAQPPAGRRRRRCPARVPTGRFRGRRPGESMPIRDRSRMAFSRSLPAAHQRQLLGPRAGPSRGRR